MNNDARSILDTCHQRLGPWSDDSNPGFILERLWAECPEQADHLTQIVGHELLDCISEYIRDLSL